jgi:hypothetical protein
MNATIFKKQIPTDFVPIAPGPIAATTYKGLEWDREDKFFLRYYNCGVWYTGLDVAIAKYNSLGAIKH